MSINCYCQNATKCRKKEIYELISTPINLLRDEEFLVKKNDKISRYELILWLKIQGFEIIGDPRANLFQTLTYAYGVIMFDQFTNTGMAKCSDLQATKDFGIQRMHWRIYEFNRELVIESHIDEVSPKASVLGHAIDHYAHKTGLLNESKHHVIRLDRS